MSPSNDFDSKRTPLFCICHGFYIYVEIVRPPRFNQTSAESTIHALSLSRFCPENHVRCPDSVRIFEKSCPLFGRTRTRKNCPYFRYPCPPMLGSNYKLLNSENMIKSKKVHGSMIKPNKQSCFCFPNRKVKTIVRISLETQLYLMSCGIWMI